MDGISVDVLMFFLENEMDSQSHDETLVSVGAFLFLLVLGYAALLSQQQSTQ
jgi:hypothetical protein